MTAAFATIVFLAAAWAAVVAIARSLEDSLPQIAAAMRGKGPLALAQPVAIRVSPRYPQARVQRAAARPALRAAA